MNENFKIGDVLAVKRMGGLYHHYGVYVGNGEVVHFSADDGSGINETDPSKADVIKTSLKVFSKGDEVSVDIDEDARYSGEEIAKRAECLIGTQKGKYDLAVNNCEHFAKFCKTGYKTSDQVENVKNVIPAGNAIAVIKDAKNKARGFLVDVFNNLKVDLNKVQNRIGKKTSELLSTYNSQSYDGKSVKEWTKGLSISEKDYDEINKEIDDNDRLSEDYESAYNDCKSKGKVFTPYSWFSKIIGKKLSRDDCKQACDEIQRRSFTALRNGLDSPASSTPSGFDALRTDTKENVRNSKILLAAGIKKAGSLLFCAEVPNDLATPIACGCVDIKKAVTDFAKHKNPVKFGFEVTKPLVVSGAQLIKNSSKHPVFIANVVAHCVTPLVKKIGVPVVGAIKSSASKVIGGLAAKLSPKPVTSPVPIKKTSFLQKLIH